MFSFKHWVEVRNNSLLDIDSIVSVNKLISNENELHQINPDVVQDPTLPRTSDTICPLCGHHKSGF